MSLFKVFLVIIISFFICEKTFSGVKLSDPPDCSNKDFSCTGRIFKKDNTFIGSCVFLSDKWAITCLHVVSDANLEAYDPKNFYILSDESIKIEIVELKFKESKDDICLLKINKPSKIKTCKIDYKEPEHLEDLYFSGWGLVSCNKPDPDNILFSINLPKERTTFKNRLEEYNLFIEISKENENKERLYGMYTFSCPEVAIEGEGVISPGDSGSGVFIKDGNKFKLIGVSSSIEFDKCKKEDELFPYNPFTTNVKNLKGFYIPLFAHKEWIRDIVEENAGLWYE